MRICRDDDPVQQNRRRELRAQPPTDQMYPSSNDMYKQQPQPGMYPQYQQPYPAYPPMPDQQQPMQMQGFGQTPR